MIHFNYHEFLKRLQKYYVDKFYAVLQWNLSPYLIPFPLFHITHMALCFVNVFNRWVTKRQSIYLIFGPLKLLRAPNYSILSIVTITIFKQNSVNNKHCVLKHFVSNSVILK